MVLPGRISRKPIAHWRRIDRVYCRGDLRYQLPRLPARKSTQIDWNSVDPLLDDAETHRCFDFRDWSRDAKWKWLLTEVAQQSGLRPEALVARVIRVVRRQFDDDCLFASGGKLHLCGKNDVRQSRADVSDPPDRPETRRDTGVLEELDQHFVRIDPVHRHDWMLIDTSALRLDDPDRRSTLGEFDGDRSVYSLPPIAHRKREVHLLRRRSPRQTAFDARPRDLEARFLPPFVGSA